ncbi:helix-turn-helix domain-containing protein [Thalassobacillus pellis]|uniref:helix-turn-helix domain-containing protein n=1 Tax=Thalassobacillus pellis TaxID=748008 RepID=UPI00195F388F|nr:XRE family transcriptional regulator [Thalassobacillus pellis]MBM7553525.1 transcriptional regulator with XRE-family HTH domain [Thalassobacillus pellis]
MKDKIGKEIKDLRKQNRLTLKQVSEKTGLSISFLSQVERSKSSVTLESLKKISEVLGVNPSHFFPSGPNSAVKRNTVKDKLAPISNFIYKDLSGEFEKPLFTPILVTLNPGDNNGKPITHEGQEFLYVLQGKLTVLIEEEEHVLNPHDCIHFDSTVPHDWFNRTDEIVKFLCISPNPGSN